MCSSSSSSCTCQLRQHFAKQLLLFLLFLLQPPHRLPLGFPPLQPVLCNFEEQGEHATLLLLEDELFRAVGEGSSNKGFGILILQTRQIQHRRVVLVGASGVQRMDGRCILGQQQHTATGAKHVPFPDDIIKSSIIAQAFTCIIITIIITIIGLYCEKVKRVCVRKWKEAVDVFSVDRKEK